MRIVIAHSNRSVGEGLALLLQRYSELEVVQVVSDERAALAAVGRLKPLAVAINTVMPGLKPDRFVTQVHNAAAACHVIFLTPSPSEVEMRRALEAGARAYLWVGVEPNELAKQVEVAGRGHTVVSSAVSKGFTEYVRSEGKSVLSGLSKREVEVLQLVALGKSNVDIAEAIFVTENTVKSHVRSLLGKLSLRSRNQLTAFAHKTGLALPE